MRHMGGPRDRDGDGEADESRPERVRVVDSGAVGDSVHLEGTYVGGRDVHVHLESDLERADLYMYQLPPDIGDFTGRGADLARLRRLLGRKRRDTPVVISAIAGKAGVGKTALATKAAHQLRSRFPDGQLYVNLRGTEAQRLDPADVLGEFLLALGVARSAIPDDLNERASRYRARLADRSVLVLLDNAVSESQVRMLLPGSSSSAALITSRVKLNGLEGANFVTLEVLEAEEAIRLLAKIAGRRRVAAEPDAARRIVELCGHLPLAVRIAGAKLAARPHWPLRRLVERLTDERRRLAELTIGDLEVRASFALSYKGLTADEQRAFRLLGLLEAPDFPSWVAGAMLDEHPSDAEELVERLVEAHVLEVAREAGDAGAAAPPDPAIEPHGARYRFHDLLRVFARERLLDDAPQNREAALQRALQAYLLLAAQAAALVDPARRIRDAGGRAGPEPLGEQFHIPGRLLDNPVTWLAMERTSLIAAVEQAHERGLWELCWKLAASLAYICDLHNHWTDWQHTQELALDASRQARNRHAEANGLRSLGTVHLRQIGSEPLGREPARAGDRPLRAVPPDLPRAEGPARRGPDPARPRQCLRRAEPDRQGDVVSAPVQGPLRQGEGPQRPGLDDLQLRPGPPHPGPLRACHGLLPGVARRHEGDPRPPRGGIRPGQHRRRAPGPEEARAGAREVPGGSGDLRRAGRPRRADLVPDQRRPRLP